MAAPNYDLLNNVQDLLTNPNSPIVKAVQQEMAQYEKQKGMTDEKYNQIAAAKLMEKIQAHLGGSIPDRAQAEQFDWDRSAKALQGDAQFKGTPDEALEIVKKGSKPYANAYGTIDALRAMLPTPPTPASIQPPPAPAPAPAPAPGPPAAKAAPAPMPKVRETPPATDDEKLGEGLVLALQELSKSGGPQWKNTILRAPGEDPDTGLRFDVRYGEDQVDPKTGLRFDTKYFAPQETTLFDKNDHEIDPVTGLRFDLKYEPSQLRRSATDEEFNATLPPERKSASDKDFYGSLPSMPAPNAMMPLPVPEKPQLDLASLAQTLSDLQRRGK